MVFFNNTMQDNRQDILPDIDISNVPDNIDEAVSNIIYETEVNYSSLMRAVGIADLTCMEQDGDVIYEAVDMKAFFNKIKDFFKSILTKIATLFKKIAYSIDEWFTSKAMKSFTKSEQFKNLKSVPKDFKYTGFEYTASNILNTLGKPHRCLTSTTLYKNSGKVLDWSNLSGLYEPKDFADKISGKKNYYKGHFEAREKWIAKANDPETRKTTISEMRAYMVTRDRSEIEKFDDWQTFLFSLFRNGKTKPDEILAKDININEYKGFLTTGYADIKKLISDGYKNQKDITDKVIAEFQRQLKEVEDRYGSMATTILYGKSRTKTNEGYDVYSTASKMVNATVYYFKAYIQDVNSIYVANIRALVDEAKQYKGAIARMIAVSSPDNITSSGSEEKEEKSEPLDGVVEQELTCSILDTVNFI